MGNGMNKIVDGVYVGNFRDAKDEEQMEANKITHILSIHDDAKPLLSNKKYLCIAASDTPGQDLSEYFPKCIYFIHKARMKGGNVLIHCLAGVSRSVTVTAAYLMTVTSFGWRNTLNAIRGARSCANPNFGFQKQLQQYENDGLEKARAELKLAFPTNPFNDEKQLSELLTCYQRYILTGEANSPSELYSLPHNAYEGRNKRSSASNGGAAPGSKESTDTHDVTEDVSRCKIDTEHQGTDSQKESSEEKMISESRKDTSDILSVQEKGDIIENGDS